MTSRGRISRDAASLVSGMVRLTFGSFGLFLHGYLLLLHANKQWYEQSRAQSTRPVAEGVER